MNNTTRNKNSILNNRWLILSAGVLIFIICGTVYSWSILKTVLYDEFGWNVAQLSLNYTIIVLVSPAGIYLNGRISSRLSPQIRLIISAFFLFLGMCASTFMNSDCLILLYFLWGLLGGLSSGLAYGCMISVIGQWFPDRKGTAFGILLFGYGSSPLIVGNLASAMLQSALEWRSVFLILGISSFFIIFVCSFLIKTPPAEFAKSVGIEKAACDGGKNFTPKQMLRCRSFWTSFLFFAVIDIMGFTITSIANDLALQFELSITMAAFLVGMFSVCNGAARLLTGFLLDKLGPKFVSLLSASIAILSCSAVALSLFSHNTLIGVLGLCFIGCAYGMGPVTLSYLTDSYFGALHFSTNYSIMSTTIFVSAPFVSIGGLLITVTGSYVYPILMLVILNVGGLFGALLCKRP